MVDLSHVRVQGIVNPYAQKELDKNTECSSTISRVFDLSELACIEAE
jgi:hypothetical protein